MCFTACSYLIKCVCGIMHYQLDQDNLYMMHLTCKQCNDIGFVHIWTCVVHTYMEILMPRDLPAGLRTRTCMLVHVVRGR